jgi:hypothetical protein
VAIPIKSWREFEGEHVYVAYNLHTCRVGSPLQPGEACFTLRYKPGGKVQAHLTEISLSDITPKILPGTLQSIRRQGSRQVCCYIEGTVVNPKHVQGRKVQASFNPFEGDTFYLTGSGADLVHADYAVFEDRTMYVIRPNHQRVTQAARAPVRVPVRNPTPVSTSNLVSRLKF